MDQVKLQPRQGGMHRHDESVANPVLVTVNETGRLIGLGRTKIYELIKAERLQSVKVGRRRLVVFASIFNLANGKKR